MTSPAAPSAGVRPSTAAPARRRVAAQARFETRMILRNGEQLLVTIALPLFLLVGLDRVHSIEIDTGAASRIDFITPGVLAVAIMSTSFTSQAIATAFDRRNGVLRLMATTPLGRGGLLAGKVLGVLTVEVVQVVVLTIVALALGWSPSAAGIPLAIVAALLGTAAFTSLAIFLAGVLRAEGVLAVANLLLVVLIAAGGALIPPSHLAVGWGNIAAVLPSGALGDALRGALIDGSIPVGPVIVLLVWTVALGWAARRFFRWQ
jgi:ABC-2 type transport system permease protein